ncbi:MAG: hypothetical protein U0M08_06640 [Clostridia bacterium]|nr:hypothetical protein [Clostridia bacterium]
MACFIVPAAEAVIATIAAKVIKKKEKENQKISIESEIKEAVKTERIQFSRKLKWLTNLLWGGSVLLAFEHLWHGEIVPWFPFLTAAGDPESTAEMLREMATAGVSMALLITVVWGIMLLAVHSFERKESLKSVGEENKVGFNANIL